MSFLDNPISKNLTHVEIEHVPTSPDKAFHSIARLCGIAKTQPKRGRASTFRTTATYESCQREIDRQARIIRQSPEVRNIAPGSTGCYTMSFADPIGIMFYTTDNGHIGAVKAYEMELVIDKPADPTKDIYITSFYPTAPKTPNKVRDFSKELMTTAEFKALNNPAERVRALSVVTPTAPVLAYDPVKDAAFIECAGGRLETDGSRVAFRYPNGHRYASTNANAEIWQDPTVCDMRDKLLMINTRANPPKSRPSAVVPHEVDIDHPHRTTRDFER